MAYCSKCGAQVAEHVAYCPQCGQPQVGAPGAAPPAAGGARSGMSENVAALLCYVLGWITGLIFFLVDKRPYVRFHAAQSIVVFGALHILSVALGIMFGVGWLFGGVAGWSSLGVGVLLHLVARLAGFFLWIVLMVKAYQGERFRVPVAADLAESFAGK